MREIKVLMVGYNGANNTGAEALLLSDIEDVRRVLGPSARITVRAWRRTTSAVTCRKEGGSG